MLSQQGSQEGEEGEVPREWGSLSLWELSHEIGPAVEQFKRGQTCLECGVVRMRVSARGRRSTQDSRSSEASLVRCVLMMLFTRSTLPDDWGL